MKYTGKSFLFFVLNTDINCYRTRQYIPSINTYIDYVDIRILRLVSQGYPREDIAKTLCKTVRTIENRLSKLRVMFNCKNTSHLIAKLALMSVGGAKENVLSAA